MIIHVPGKGLTAGLVLAGGEVGRGAGGVGEKSKGGTLCCLGAGEWPGDSGGNTPGLHNQAGGRVGQKIFQSCQPPATTLSRIYGMGCFKTM